MNSQEIEKSLNNEIDGYVDEKINAIRSDIADFRRNITSELERHARQIEDFTEVLASGDSLIAKTDQGFENSVIEHLRLARDEGASLTAAAISEAEDLHTSREITSDFSTLRDALIEISHENSQADILTALVSRISQFAPRGALFIVRNSRLIGWDVFGEGDVHSGGIRSVEMPISSESSLSEAAENLATIECKYGTHRGDDHFLAELEFGEPEMMCAIPMIVSERSVAVIYADRGDGTKNVNVSAIETLVQAAGSRVELLVATLKEKNIFEREEGPDVRFAEESKLKIEQENPNGFEQELILPFEVAENEREIHLDALRFARLLVSEIQLYNGQAVREGRETNRIYELLSDPIERSREMYHNRVSPDMITKFDYFNFEIWRVLAGGDESKLGKYHRAAS